MQMTIDRAPPVARRIALAGEFRDWDEATAEVLGFIPSLKRDFQIPNEAEVFVSPGGLAFYWGSWVGFARSEFWVDLIRYAGVRLPGQPRFWLRSHRLDGIVEVA